MEALKDVAQKKLVKARKAYLKFVRLYNEAESWGFEGLMLDEALIKMEVAHADLIGAEALARQLGVFKVA